MRTQQLFSYSAIIALINACTIKALRESHPGRKVNYNETPSQSIDVRQYDALQRFYVSTAMESARSRPLHNWLFDNDAFLGDYCNFTGITCDGERYVTAVDLDDSGLSGTLPDTFCDLPRLKRLRLYNNSIYGTIPDSLLHIPTLNNLNLGNNFVSGEFPDLSELSLLSRVCLSRNAISGTLPSSLCKLTNLELLEMSYVTEMRGQIPSCLGSLTALSTFRVTDVGLSGTLPSELCSMWRDMNGLSPNPFGCNAIACPAGFFQHAVGRQASEGAKCMPCDVSSNVIGSTTCQWNEFFDRTVSPSVEGTPLDTSPPSGTSISTPTNSPFMIASESPSIPAPTSSHGTAPVSTPFTAAPSASPQPTTSTTASTTTPSIAPTTQRPIAIAPTILPSPLPMMRPTWIPTMHPTSTASSSTPTFNLSETGEPSFPSSAPSTRSPLSVSGITVESGSGRDQAKPGYLIGATVSAVCVAFLALLFLWKRRSLEPGHVRIADDASSTLDPSLYEAPAAPELQRAEMEFGSIMFHSAADEPSFMISATAEDALAPVTRRVPSILRTSLSSDQNIARRAPLPTSEDSIRKVRFTVPEPLSAKTYVERFVTRTTASTNDATSEDREAWLAWILNPLFDPIIACGAPARGPSNGYQETDSAISFDSSYSTLSAMFAAVNEADSPVASDLDEESPSPIPELYSVLGIRDRSALNDDKSFDLPQGTVSGARHVNDGFCPITKRLEPSNSTINVIEASYHDIDDDEIGEGMGEV